MCVGVGPLPPVSARSLLVLAPAPCGQKSYQVRTPSAQRQNLRKTGPGPVHRSTSTSTTRPACRVATRSITRWLPEPVQGPPLPTRAAM